MFLGSYEDSNSVADSYRFCAKTSLRLLLWNFSSLFSFLSPSFFLPFLFYPSFPSTFFLSFPRLLSFFFISSSSCFIYVLDTKESSSCKTTESLVCHTDSAPSTERALRVIGGEEQGSSSAEKLAVHSSSVIISVRRKEEREEEETFEPFFVSQERADYRFVFLLPAETYEGMYDETLLAGQRWVGRVVIRWNSGARYEGRTMGDKLSDPDAIYQWPSGNIYRGGMKDDVFCGRGVMVYEEKKNLCSSFFFFLQRLNLFFLSFFRFRNGEIRAGEWENDELITSLDPDRFVMLRPPLPTITKWRRLSKFISKEGTCE